MTDNKPYNNFKATLAIAKASFRSIVRSPSSVVFTLLFPLIFILVFGFISGGGVISVDVGVAKTCDTTGPVYQALKHTKVVNLIRDQSTAEMSKNLLKGTIDAIIDIKKNGDAAQPAGAYPQPSATGNAPASSGHSPYTLK